MIWVESVPTGWTLRTIGEVADIVGGGTPKTSVDGNFSDEPGHPWLTPADLTGYTDKYIARGRRYLTDQGLAGSSAKYMPAGTVLFSSRAPIGYIAIASNAVTTNQGFRSFVPSAEIDSEYLYYALKFLRPLAESLASGTTFPELSGSKAATMPLAYPTLSVQRAIVRALDKADAAAQDASLHLRTAQRLIHQLRAAVRAAACSGRLTVDWRTSNPTVSSAQEALARVQRFRKQRAHVEQAVDLELPDVPETYAVSTIGSCAEVVEYGTSQRCDAKRDGWVPVLRMGNIQDGALDLTSLKYCAPDAKIRKLILRDGDLLFNRTNSPELVGKAAVFRSTTPMSFASYIIRVKFFKTVAEPEYVNYWINSAWGREWARLAKTDGVSQSNINGSKLKLMPIPLAPIEEQRVIVDRASEMLARIDELERRIASASLILQRTSQSVLDKAFRGELALSDPQLVPTRTKSNQVA